MSQFNIIGFLYIDSNMIFGCSKSKLLKLFLCLFAQLSPLRNPLTPKIIKFCMCNVLIIWKISTRKKFIREIEKIRDFFPIFFFLNQSQNICAQKNHDLRIFFATYNLRGKTAEVLSAKNCERSEQTAGVLAQAPEG